MVLGVRTIIQTAESKVRLMADSIIYESYPINEAHGNNVGAVSKNGSGFNLSDEKSYDAWGALRSGNNSGGKATYCANLGHKHDDESGLIYMRARYYEPGSGRFISQDPGRDGNNWFTYVKSNPINLVDPNGKEAAGPIGCLVEFFKAILSGIFDHPNGLTSGSVYKAVFKTAWGYQEGLVTAWAIQTCTRIVNLAADGYIKAMSTGNLVGGQAIIDAALYSIMIVLFIDAIDILGGEALADTLFDGGEKTKKWLPH